MTIRTVIADDHLILLEALTAMLAGEPDIAVVGTAADGMALLALVAQAKPEVVVLDIGMPGMNGIEVLHQLTRKGADVRTVVLSGFSDRRFVIEALDAGAAGYVLKSAAADELPRAIRAVAGGKTYLCPDVAAKVIAAARTAGKYRAMDETRRLAPRERAVVRLLAEGRTSGEIAAQLHIAPSTVDTHRRNIMRKLDLHSVAEITRYAIREGIAVP